MWRFLHNHRLILRLHYFQGTHILGASRSGPCDSVASCGDWQHKLRNTFQVRSYTWKSLNCHLLLLLLILLLLLLLIVIGSCYGTVSLVSISRYQFIWVMLLAGWMILSWQRSLLCWLVKSQLLYADNALFAVYYVSCVILLKLFETGWNPIMSKNCLSPLAENHFC